MEVIIYRNQSAMQLTIVYHSGHPCMDWIFLDEHDSFAGSFTSKYGKLLICVDFNYWDDDPAHKPYLSEFMGFLNTDDFEKLLVTNLDLLPISFWCC